VMYSTATIAVICVATPRSPHPNPMLITTL
jgi:hypothetical protein